MKKINAAEKMELDQKNKVLSNRLQAAFLLLKDDLQKMDFGLETIFDCKPELSKLASSMKNDLNEIARNKQILKGGQRQ